MNILTTSESPRSAKIAERVWLGSIGAAVGGIIIEFVDNVADINQVLDAANQAVIQGSVATGLLSGLAAGVLARNTRTDTE